MTYHACPEKKILYLDQFALVEMAKALDTTWKVSSAKRQIWVELFDALDRALKLNLIACPRSPFHRQESAELEHLEVVRRLYEHLSAGCQFRSHDEIWRRQVWRVYDRCYRSGGAESGMLFRHQAISGNLNEWLDDITIEVRWAALEVSADAVQSRRSALQGDIDCLAEGWRARNATFEDVYRVERIGVVRPALLKWREYVSLRVEWEEGRLAPSDPRALELADPNALASLCHDLATAATNDGVTTTPKAVEWVSSFLSSDEVASVPSNDLSALMFAALARKVVSGQKRVEASFFVDQQIVSAYSPYADAMLLDRHTVSLLQDAELAARISGFARAYSVGRLPELISWLRDLEVHAGAHHVALVEKRYGAGWLVPFRTIIEAYRARENRRAVDGGQRRRR